MTTNTAIASTDGNFVREIFSRTGLLRPAGENPKPEDFVLLLAIFPDRSEGLDAIMGLAAECEVAHNLCIDHSRLRFVVATSTEEVRSRDCFSGMRFGFIIHADDLPIGYPELASILPVH